MLATKFSVSGAEYEAEELVMCEYAFALLAGDLLRFVIVDNGLPARLDEVDAFIQRPFCSVGGMILPAGARRLLLNEPPSLRFIDGVSYICRRRRLVRVDVDGDWNA